jgi:hypothetical protein
MHALHSNRRLIDVNGKFDDKRVASNEFAAGFLREQVTSPSTFKNFAPENNQVNRRIPKILTQSFAEF